MSVRRTLAMGSLSAAAALAVATLWPVSQASAASYNINVNTVPGSVHHMISTKSTDPEFYTTGVWIGNGNPPGGGADATGWAQFIIPTLAAGESITSLIANVHCEQLTANPPGAYLAYTSDDGWNPIIGVRIFPTQSPYVADPSSQQTIANIGDFVPGDYQVDISSFLLQPGEGPGQPLSMSMNYFGGGIRGALLGYDNILWPSDPAAITLTLNTIIGGGASWSVDASGNWNEPAYWTGGVPNAVDATALFGSAITQPQTVTVDSPVTVGAITFDNANAYTLAGTSTLTLDVTSGSASISVLSGSHTISAPLALADNTTVSVVAGQTLSVSHVRGQGLSIASGTVKVLSGGTPNAAAGTSVVTSLSIAGGAQLDVTNNSMIVDYSTAATLVDDTRQMLASGQLTSSSTGGKLGYADNAVLHLTSFGGQTVDDTNLLIKFTYGGDANLDGQVDISDLGALATAWQTSAPWTGGDFDYSGFVDISDLGILATNWQLGVGSPLGPSFDEALASVGLAGVSVPEPTVGLLVMVGAIGQLARRKRAPR